MFLLSLKEVQIAPDRQRKEFSPENLMELMDSIRTNGLMNPITVRAVTDQQGVLTYYLVAGERRLRSIRELQSLGQGYRHGEEEIGVGNIPCVDFGSLSILQAEELELDENLKRTDLTWQERNEAIARLQKLRETQALADGRVQTFAATADELFGGKQGAAWGPAAVSEAVLVTRHLTDPEVAKAKSTQEAVKIIKNKAKKEQLVAQAAAMGDHSSSDSHRLILTDCLTWLAACPPAQFDVICTDPPYGMSSHNFGDSDGRISQSHDYDDSIDSFHALMEAFIPETFRVTRPSAHLWMFFDLRHWEWLRTSFELSGWSVFKTPLVNTKPAGGRVPIPSLGIRRSYELILFAWKGGREALRTGNDVIEGGLAPGEDFVFAAQKPVSVITDLLSRSARPGDQVLDPFAGSGTILLAGHPLKLFITALERDPAAYALAKQRLDGLTGGK